MGAEISRLKINIGKEELAKMTREVRETLAIEHLAQDRIFSSADLWNIQRRKKNISWRRVNA